MSRADISAAEADLRAVHATEMQAMVAGDISALEAMLDNRFTLTHMTGSRQTKTEWLKDIESQSMTYHEIVTESLTIEYEGTVPVLTARTRTRATIWGTTGNWRLQIRSWFEPHANGWVILRTVASTW